MRNIIGIDLGTTFSAVARVVPQSGEKTIKAEIIKNGDGRSITPSVIQFLPDGDIVFGSEAKEAAEFGEDGCAQTFKRSMGSSDIYCAFYGKTYTAEDLSTLLLKHLKEEAERSLGGRIDSAVVTVPAYFRDAERRSTMNAAKRAGLNVLCLLDEPVAAAINYGMGHWRDNAVIMVYDLGGGTFDVTIVKMEKGHLETMYTAGNHVLGGKDWDNALVDIVCRKYYEETGERIDEDIAIRHAIGMEIEETKKALSMTNSHRTVVDLPGIGSYSCQITRAEFESETLPLLNNTAALCNQLLQDAGLNWKNITDILLVGGSTRMPQVKQCLKRISGLTPLEGIVNPDEAVALGAAIRAHALDQAGEIAYVRPDEIKKGSKYVEVCLPKGKVGQETFGDELMVATPTVRLSHALGVVAVNEAGTAYSNQVIIPTNTRVPCSISRKFKFLTSPMRPNILEIYVLEGDGELFSGECQFLAKYEVEGIKHVRGGADIEIQYSKDLSSITHVQVRQGNDNIDLPIREVPLDDTSRFMQQPEVVDNKVNTYYSEWAGVSNIPRANLDRFGNPEGSQYDLGLDNGFIGYKILIVNYCTAAEMTHVVASLKKKGFEVTLYKGDISVQDLRRELEDACQLWVISQAGNHMTQAHYELIRHFFDAGHGIYIWGDNDPLNDIANFIIGQLFNSHLSGDYYARQILGIQNEPGMPGIIPNHLISTGLVSFFEGDSIAKIKMNNDLQPLTYSSDRNIVTAYYDKHGKRALIDGAFTRLWDHDWGQTAGTERYIVNAAVWLVNLEGNYLQE